MAGIDMKNTIVIGLITVIALFILYQFDPTFFGLFGRREGFAGAPANKGANGLNNPNYKQGAPQPGSSPGAPTASLTAGAKTVNAANPPNQPSMNSQSGVMGQDLKTQPGAAPAAPKEGFADLSAYEGPADFASVDAPAGCYPRDQLTPSELLPADQSSIWAQQNPMGPGSLKGKNFLSAGALIGVNTVGQSLRNANLQIRSEPPNPQVPVSIFNQSTISPDISHRPLEIGA